MLPRYQNISFLGQGFQIYTSLSILTTWTSYIVMDHVVMTTGSQFLQKMLDVGFQYVKIYVFGVKDSEFGHYFLVYLMSSVPKKKQ